MHCLVKDRLLVANKSASAKEKEQFCPAGGPKTFVIAYWNGDGEDSTGAGRNGASQNQGSPSKKPKRTQSDDDFEIHSRSRGKAKKADTDDEGSDEHGWYLGYGIILLQAPFPSLKLVRSIFVHHLTWSDTPLS